MRQNVAFVPTLCVFDHFNANSLCECVTAIKKSSMAVNDNNNERIGKDQTIKWSKAGSAITVEMSFGKIMLLDLNIAWAETVRFETQCSSQ